MARQKSCSDSSTGFKKGAVLSAEIKTGSWCQGNLTVQARLFHCSNHPFHTLLVDGIIQNPTTLLLKLFKLLLPDELWGFFSEGRKNGYLLGKI